MLPIFSYVTLKQMYKSFLSVGIFNINIYFIHYFQPTVNDVGYIKQGLRFFKLTLVRSFVTWFYFARIFIERVQCVILKHLFVSVWLEAKKSFLISTLKVVKVCRRFFFPLDSRSTMPETAEGGAGGVARLIGQGLVTVLIRKLYQWSRTHD